MKTNEENPIKKAQFTLYSADGLDIKTVDGWVGVTSHSGIFIAAVGSCQFHVVKASHGYKRIYDGCYTSISAPKVCPPQEQTVPGKLLLEALVSKGQGQLLIIFEKDSISEAIKAKFGNLIRNVA